MSPPDRPRPPPKIILIITALRAGLAIVLGVALLFDPGKTRPMLLNYMGMFWLITGLIGLQWRAHNQQQRRRALFVGVISVLTGLMALSYNFSKGLVDEPLALVLLGGIIVVTGVIHIIEGIPNVYEGRRQRSRLSLVLGVFELVLGSLLFYTSLEIWPIIYVLATAWALLSGMVLIREVLTMWRLHWENKAAQQP